MGKTHRAEIRKAIMERIQTLTAAKPTGHEDLIFTLGRWRIEFDKSRWYLYEGTALRAQHAELVTVVETVLSMDEVLQISDLHYGENKGTDPDRPVPDYAGKPRPESQR